MQRRAEAILLMAFGLLALQGASFLVVRAATTREDWAHPLLHLASGALGLALAASPRALARYGLGFGAAYALLGVAGALGMARLAWLPLAAADHLFHVTLGMVVAAAAWPLLRARVRSAPRWGP